MNAKPPDRKGAHPNPRRGRDLFRSFRTPLRLAEAVFRACPAWLTDVVWVWSDLAPRLIGVGLRYSIARAKALSCGDNVMFERGVEIRSWARLSIGSNVSVNRFCYIDAAGRIDIRDDVSVAHHSSLISANHSWQDPETPIRDNPVDLAPIVIENDVWIGSGCRILAGVVVGSRSVIAAGAVVTKNVPPGTLAAGIPARTIKQLDSVPTMILNDPH